MCVMRHSAARPNRLPPVCIKHVRRRSFSTVGVSDLAPMSTRKARMLEIPAFLPLWLMTMMDLGA